jgi:hypothetical protein
MTPLRVRTYCFTSSILHLLCLANVIEEMDYDEEVFNSILEQVFHMLNLFEREDLILVPACD